MITRRGVLTVPALALARNDGEIALADRRELFVDRYLIEVMAGAELRAGTALDRGTVFGFGHSSGGPFSNYATLIQHGGKIRLYYRGVPSAGPDGRGDERTYYAESSDGKTFSPPQVILRDTPPYQHNFSPLVDRDGTFKALAGTSKTGLRAYVSMDGVAWKPLRDEPVIVGGAFDSQNVAFWSQHEGKYVCYYRTFQKIGGTNYRWISRATSSNFVDWNYEGEMEFGGAPPEHLYTNQTSPYLRAPHIYLALCARFMPGRQVLTEQEAKAVGVDPGFYRDCSDAVLMSSRGGNRFDRTFLEAFLRPGPGLNNWVSRSNYPALNLVQTQNDELSFYVVRDYGQQSIHLQRYTVRMDGFASLHGGYSGGMMLTKPFTYRGSKLEINFSTSAAGSLQFVLEDLEGRKLVTSPEVIGDQLARIVPIEVGQWAGKAVRLRIVLKDADLYSFRFLP
jgi:hypothetical protein